MGTPMISTIGLGRSSVNGRSLSPLPPARMIAYTRKTPFTETPFHRVQVVRGAVLRVFALRPGASSARLTGFGARRRMSQSFAAAPPHHDDDGKTRTRVLGERGRRGCKRPQEPPVRTTALSRCR